MTSGVLLILYGWLNDPNQQETPCDPPLVLMDSHSTYSIKQIRALGVKKDWMEVFYVAGQRRDDEKIETTERKSNVERGDWKFKDILGSFGVSNIPVVPDNKHKGE